MRIYNLQFATIVPLQDNIAEVIVRRDIELDVAMVETYHEFLRDHFRSPFALLINKKYAYTFSFEAQLKIAEIPEIAAIGIVTYNSLSKEFTQSMIDMPREKTLNAKIFTKREEALQWIKLQLNQQNNAVSNNLDASTWRHHGLHLP